MFTSTSLISLALSFGSLFGTGQLPEAAAVAALDAPATADAAPLEEAAVIGQWQCIVSPWGWSANYFVHPGHNTLVCSGTGCLFTYHHCGWAAEQELR